MNRRSVGADKLRPLLEERVGRISDRDFAHLVQVTGLNPNLAPGDADLAEAIAALLDAPDFRQAFGAKVARYKAALGLQDGVRAHARTLWALRRLAELDLSGELQRPDIPTADMHRGLGELVLTYTAALRLMRVTGVPFGTCLGALTARPGSEAYLLGAEDADGVSLQELLDGVAVSLHRQAFPDERRTLDSSDLRFVRAILVIEGHTRSARKKERESAEQRWTRRLLAYESQCAATFGRSFLATQVPWRSLRSAFQKSRKRLKDVSGPWPELDAIV